MRIFLILIYKIVQGCIKKDIYISKGQNASEKKEKKTFPNKINIHVY